MEKPGFWDDPAANAPLLQRQRALEQRLATLQKLRANAGELDA